MLSYNVPELSVCLCKSKSPTESRYFVCWTDGEKETRRVKHNDKLCAERKRNIRTNATKTINNSFFVNDLRWCCFFSTEHIRQSIHSTYCESAETIVMRMHVPFLRRSLLAPFSVFQLRLSTSSLAATVHKKQKHFISVCIQLVLYAIFCCIQNEWKKHSQSNWFVSQHVDDEQKS